MAKKKKTKVKKANENAKQIQYLNILLKFTTRNIRGDNSILDQLFTSQADKLRNKINELS